jgi:hypothetical protein
VRTGRDVTNDDEKTLTVEEAGRRYFGMSRSRSYAAAKMGFFPTVKVGRRIYVPVIAIERMLAEAKAPQSDEVR